MQFIEISIILALIVWQGWVYYKNRGLIAQVASMYPATSELSIRRENTNKGATAPSLSKLDQIRQGKASFKWAAKDPNGEYIISGRDAEGKFIVSKWAILSNRWHEISQITEHFLGQYYKDSVIIYGESQEGQPAEANPEKGYDAVAADETSPQFTQILQDTNDYLQANKGAAAAFDTLRDISERESNLLDEEIQAQISTPLYLGLLGTFAGAIIGLFSLLYPPDHIDPSGAERIRNTYIGDSLLAPQSMTRVSITDSAQFYGVLEGSRGARQAIHQELLQKEYAVPKEFSEFQSSIIKKSSGFDDEAINSFLLGILIAMGGSIFGLGFTLRGNQELKAARKTRDRLKNAYYNFLQKALLPKLNSDMQQSMSSLKAVLDTFNQDFFAKIQTGFFSKIAEFTPLIGAITANITIQKDFLEKLQNIGYTQLANATIKVFDRVDESAASFEKFLGYQQALNVAVSKGAETATTITALLNRLGTLEKSLNEVPGYLEKHDARISEQVRFFGQHNQLLTNVGAKINQALSEDAAQMHQVLDNRRQTLEAEAQAAHAQWDAYFRKLNDDNIFQKITEYLNPFQQLPAQQQALNKLQEEQARRSAAALTALQERIGRDAQVQQQLLEQGAKTNELLAKLSERSLLQRWFGGGKPHKPNGPNPAAPKSNRHSLSEGS